MPNAASPSNASKHASTRRRQSAFGCPPLVSSRWGRRTVGAAALAGLLSTLCHSNLCRATPARAAPLVAPADAAVGAASVSWAKAFAQGQWAAAIELIETIPESSRTASQWLHLARALERSSKLVEAFAAFEHFLDLAAEGRAAAGLKPSGSKDFERQAKAESSALASRIPWAEVSLARALPVGALVFIDQQWLEPTRLRSPYPVNPGWHTFLVESNGEVLAARRAFFEEGQTRLVPLTALDIRELDINELDIRELDIPKPGLATNAESPAAVSPIAADSAPRAGALGRSRALTRPPALAWRANDRSPLGVDAGHDTGGLLRASYVSLGVGALGTLVGTGFLISALNTRSSISEYTNCFSSRCEASAVADAEHANRTWRARAGAATASYAVGLSGLVAGGVLWLLHRDSSARATTVNIADLSLELAPRFSPHGAMLRGTF